MGRVPGGNLVQVADDRISVQARWMMKIHRKIVRPLFSIDLKSYYKSIWFFWWLITWRFELGRIDDFNISFYLRG